MENQSTHYDVALQVCEPKFATERRYVAAELEYVRRQSAGARKWLGWPSAGIYRRKDWDQYERQLVSYAHALDRHEQEIHDGWMPFKIHVMNAGPHADSKVLVRLHVEEGAFSEHKKSPVRPPRLDGRGKTSGLKLPSASPELTNSLPLARRSGSAVISSRT